MCFRKFITSAIAERIEKALQEFDISESLFAEDDVRKTLANIIPQPKLRVGEKSLGRHPDLLAFCTNLSVTTPSSSCRYRQQETSFRPKLNVVRPVIRDHWCCRAKSLSHPLLRARYADLAWTFGKGDRIPEMVNIAIDEYIRSCAPRYRRISSNWFGAASRAIYLAFKINKYGKARTALKKLLELQRLAANNHKLGLRIFDRIMGDSRIELDQNMLHQQAHLLESYIANAKNIHTLDAAYNSLNSHSTAIGKECSVDNLRRCLAEQLEKFALEQNPLTAVIFYWPKVMEQYKAVGDRDEYERIRKHYEKMAAQARMDMQEINTHYIVGNDTIEQEIEAVIHEDLDKTLEKIAGHFVRPHTYFENILQNVGEVAPLVSNVNQTLLNDRQVVATVGATDEDPEGNLQQLAGEFYYFGDGLLLLRTMQCAMEIHDIEPSHIVDCANRHQLCSDTTLLLEGVSAWHKRDYIKSIHVLVPQIEACLRAIANCIGLPETRDRQTALASSTVIPMGTILGDEMIQSKLGEDLILYFRSIYTDARGINLRNRFAHGLLIKEDFNEHLAARVIHTLLVLGHWKELANEHTGS